jgi:membrane protein YdbS with pleckstrin-like domain
LSYSPPDPYGFFGHLDKDLLILAAICALLAFVGALTGNYLLIVASAITGLLIIIVVQAVRNRRRRTRYEYEPSVSHPKDGTLAIISAVQARRKLYSL